MALIHFFLTAGELTWQYRRALTTAKVHGVPVILWCVGEKPRPWPGVEVRSIDMPDWLEGANPQTLYDVLALQTLYEHGGMTLGLDSISVRPALDLLPEGKELVVCSDVPLVECEYRSEAGHVVPDPFNNHLIAVKGASIVGEMLAEAKRRVVEQEFERGWGVTGPLLLTEFVRENPDRIEVAPFPALCGWEGSFIWRFYQGEEPGPDVRVIHLFSSAYPAEYSTFKWEGLRGTERYQSVPSRPLLHLLAMPHTQTTSAYSSCAYTSKVRRFCKMMTARGWEIILYAGEHNEAPCAEHVILVTEAERRKWFGEGFDTVFTPLSWDTQEPYWLTMNGRAIAELSERVGKQDLILLTTGTQKIIADAWPNTTRIVCEWTVGYEGIVTPYCAFESQTFMHTVYAKRGIGDGRDFDTVIPNFFDPDEFPHLNDGQGDYLLFVGRVILRKGVAVAAEIAKHAGMKLLIAGPGVTHHEPGRIVAPEVTIEGAHVEYVGEVGIEERAELMAGARALLAPTSFLEPFGGVAVEAQICGTPAITTDHGAFMETVPREFRFRNLAQALAAVERAGEVDPVAVRERALAHFSFDAVAPMYEEWFDRLSSLWSSGWYELPAETRERIPV